MFRRARFPVLLLFSVACCAPTTAMAGVSRTGITPDVSAPVPPADPAGLTTFVLENGLLVWLHPLPDTGGAGEVGVALVVGAGSLAEEDDQRGAAYLAKRASGLGTARAPLAAIDRLRPWFGKPGRSARAADGGHATLTHESVAFALVFDADDGAAWDTALGHYADLLSGWEVDAGTMDDLRGLVAGRDADRSPEERARAAFVPELFEGQRIGRRPLVPDPGAAARLDAAAVNRFVRARYRPENATLVVVGRFDVGEALSRIRAFQGTVPGSKTEAPRLGPAVETSLGGRVSAVVVPGYEPAEVSLLTIEPADADAGPADPHRRAVLDAVGAELVGGRVRPAAAVGDAGVVSVETGMKAWIGGSSIAEISVRTEQAGLTGAGRAVATELARIRRDGFTTEEIRAARAAVLTRYEDAARAWNGANAGRVMSDLLDSARQRAPAGWLSPVERAALASVVLAGTTDADLVAHARRGFAPERLACVLIGSEPEAALAPANARAMLDAAGTAAPGPATAVPERLVELGPPGSVATISHDPATGVWTGVLSNGVLVRARRMAAEGVRVRAVLADGPGREDATTLGRTRDAVAAWEYPTAGGHGAGVVRAWAITRGLRVRPSVSEHTVALEVEGEDAAGAGDALALAAALLADPGVDGAYADRARPAWEDYGPALRRFTKLMFAPGEARARTSAPSGWVDAVAADAWLSRLAPAPLEIAVVGDVAPEEALRMAAETFGALPRRETPSRARPDAWRAWGPVPRAESLERVAAGADASGEALVGIVFGDATDLAMVRPVLIAAGAVGAELERERAAGRLDARPRAWVWLGDGIPDRATLLVWCDDAADPEAALRAIDAAIGRVADGASDASVIEKEIERARRSVERAWESPAFWADRLSKLSTQGLDIGSVAGMAGSYGSITVQDVRDALRDAAGAGVHKRVIVAPAGE